MTGKAGEGNRTLVFSLEGYCSTIELHPQRIQSPTPELTTDIDQQSRLAEFRYAFDPGTPLNTIHPNISWGVQDSNLRRQSHQIYSLAPLTARETPLRILAGYTAVLAG